MYNMIVNFYLVSESARKNSECGAIRDDDNHSDKEEECCMKKLQHRTCRTDKTKVSGKLTSIHDFH